jgi:hypothetical protein
MIKRLAPTFIDLTQDAVLKAFWYRSSLRFFLQQHGISDIDLARWQPDQTKRVYITWLWEQLIRTDWDTTPSGEARSLARCGFPDLERREDT